MKEARNCKNQQHIADPILMKDDWHLISPSRRHVLKIRDLKFYQCPVSVITATTWDVISLVNETTDGEGNILHLPFAGSYLDQPHWYREAVKLTKQERHEHRKALQNKPKYS